jgi:hypothetical protein
VAHSARGCTSDEKSGRSRSGDQNPPRPEGLCKSQEFRQILLPVAVKGLHLPYVMTKTHPTTPPHRLCPREHVRAYS